MSLITFLSDFKQQEEWISIVKGVLLKSSPKIEILDITHDIPSYNVSKASLILKRAVEYIEADVHLSIVDPGVGTRRKAIAIETKRGDFLVGPDNGLLYPAAKFLGLKKVIEITNDKYFLKPVSPTFHARDIFAPVAACLVNNKNIELYGKAFNPRLLQKTTFPKAVKKNDWLHLKVTENDSFGTVRLNLPKSEIKKFNLRINTKYQTEINGKVYPLAFVKTFGELETLQPGLIIDSSNQLSIFLNKGKASEILDLKPGKEVRIKIN